MNKAEVLQAFTLYDVNGDGIIDLEGRFWNHLLSPFF